MASSELVLAIDNSLDFLNLALAADGRLVEERHGRPVRASSEILPLKVAGLLSDYGYHLSDLSFLIVSLGPGSFTGIRVGLAFMKGVASALRLPLMGVPTLDLLAWPFSGITSSYICPLIDAKKGEVFFAQYGHKNGALQPVTGYGAAKPEEVAKRLMTPCIVFGSGVPRCEQALADAADICVVRGHHQRVTGESLIRLGMEKHHRGIGEALKPIYGRQSEAEIKFDVSVT